MPRTGGEQRKIAIVSEAIHQFGRDGYRGASIENIATAVGVRKQTLLYYFPSKDALLEACLTSAGERLAFGSPAPSRRVYLRVGIGSITIQEAPPGAEAPGAARAK